MIRISVLMLLILSGCCTAPEDEKPEAPKDKHIIYESKNYMERNDIETWIEGKWIQTSGNWSDIFLALYFELSFHDTKGKWIVTIRSHENPEIIVESSYQIIENYWDSRYHRFDIAAPKFIEAPNVDKLFYIEIGKVNDDKIKVYHRGYNLNNLPSDFDWANPDPKLAVRTGGDSEYAIYQRVK